MLFAMMYFLVKHIVEADMARNITISVPDELHEEIQQAKGNIKVSAICQEALSKAVKIAHAIESEDILALREKFQIERKKQFQPYWDEGFKNGQRDVFLLEYERAMDAMDCFIDDASDDGFYIFDHYASEESEAKLDSIESDFSYNDLIKREAVGMYHQGWLEAMHSVLKKALE